MEEKELHQTARAVRDAGRTENLQHVKDAVWQSLPSSPTAVAPWHHWRTVLATGAGITAAGVVVAAAMLWLPGAPLAPAPAFADVERAMRQINTATWTETTYRGNTEQAPIMESVRYEMQRRPEPLIIRRASSIRDKKPHNFVQITNRWGCFTPHNSDYIIWERGNRVERQILEMLYFPSLPSSQHQWEAARDLRERWGWKWARGPWKRKMATLDRRSLFQFTAQDKQWRNADSSHSPLRVTIDKAVWVDPKTFHVVRSQNQYTNSDGQWLTIRENFRYNQPLAEPVTARLPPLGKTVGIFDTSLLVPDAPQVPDSEVAEIKALLNRVGAQWSKPNSLTSGVLAPGKHGRMFASVPNLPKEKRRLVEMSERPGQKSQFRQFTVTQVAEVRYTPATYRRDRLDQVFPPALKDTPYHVIASVLGTSPTGRRVACPALFSLQRVNGTLRFTAAAFFPDKPAVAAQSWTEKALNKRHINGAQ